VVLQPDAIPGFSISIDYYDISVDNVIGTALPGDIIGACFGNVTAASAADPNCTIIRRNPVTGGLDGDPATTLGLFGPTNNLGALRTSGVDVIANWRGDIGFADLALSFVGNWTRESQFNANVAAPGSFFRECVGYYSVNCSFTGSIQPELQFSQRTTLSFDDVDVSLLWRWIDGVNYEPRAIIEDGGDANSVLARFRSIPAEHYFDLTTRWSIGDNLTLNFSVINMFDNQPKVVGNTIGSTSFNSGNVFPSTYDALGRRYAASVRLRF
jgi:iron complex outermembrane recepter protein